jgi:transposase-like protein
MQRAKYDWNAIQKARSAGMSVAEICKKFGCSDVAVYHRTKKTVAHGRHSRLDWPAIQMARTAGMPVAEICKKFKVSNASVYTKTKAGNHHANLTPTPSPFEAKHTANGDGLREQINHHLSQALTHARNERDEIHLEARILDEFIAKLETVVR